MTNGAAAAPEEFVRTQQAFQTYDAQLNELCQRGHEDLRAGRAEQAAARFRQGLQQFADFEQEWGLRLEQTAGLMGGVKAWRESRAREKVFLLSSLGQANQWRGFFGDARDNLQEALTLLGETPSRERASVLMGIAAAEQSLGRLSEAEKEFKAASQTAAAFAEWDLACMALTSAADCAYFSERRDDFLRLLDEAISLAEQNGLVARQRELLLKKYRFRLSTDPSGATLESVEQNRRRLRVLAEDKTFEIRVRLLEAEFWQEQEESTSAEEALQRALTLTRQVPDQQWAVLVALAGFCESQRRPQEALDYAERALACARTLGFREQIQQSLVQTIPLRTGINQTAQRELAQQELNELRQQGASGPLVLSLLGQAYAELGAGRKEEALAEIEEAEGCAPNRELRRLSLLAKTATLERMGRHREALEANLAALDLIGEALSISRARGLLTGWRDMLSNLAALSENAALLSAQIGDAGRAFALAEQGRAQVMRHQLISRETGEEPVPPEVNLEEARELLAEDSAVLAMFSVGKRRTLVLLLDPGHAAPDVRYLDLTEEGLAQLLPAGQFTEAWNESLLAALPVLSSKLGPVLTEAVGRSKRLYLVPERRLTSVPFAALTLEDGSPIVASATLATVPSVATLRWCRSRPAPSAKTCLAVGAGAQDEYNFAEQARAVAELDGWAEKKWLANPLPEEVLDHAPYYAVLHLACHGRVQASVYDSLAASQLEFAGRRVLTGKDIFALGGRLNAELVFLNACTSGKFQTRVESEVGGFWQSFLHAGARSLITTLAYVHPGHASQLAQEFYRNWLTGKLTRAEALQAAQQHLCRQGVPSIYWGSYVLIGDHR